MEKYLKKNKLKFEDFFEESLPGQFKFNREKIFQILKIVDPTVDKLGF